MLSKEVYEKLLAFTDREEELYNLLKTSGLSEIKHTIKKHVEGHFTKGNYFTIEKHTRFFPVKEHFHNFIEIMYVLNGEIKQKVTGVEIVLQKGELMLLNQHVSHEIEATTEKDIMINLIIKPDFFDYIISLIDENNRLSKFLLSSIYNNAKRGEYLCFHVSEVARIQSTLEEIIEEMYGDSVIKNVRIQFLMGLLVIDLINNIPRAEAYIEEGYDENLLIQILKYIEDSYENGSLKELSLELNQPNYKISKFLKEITGKTFQDLILERRLEKVKELLKNTNYSIAEIIREVGYENTTHFYKIFKEKFQMSPKEFRDIYKNKTITS